MSYDAPPPPPPGDPNNPGGGYTPPPGSYPPPPPDSGYGAPGYGGAPGSNKKALWAMILGIVGVLCCGIAGIVGLVLGLQARKEIDASGGTQTGRGQATAGIVLGIIAIVLWIIVIIFRVVAASNS